MTQKVSHTIYTRSAFCSVYYSLLWTSGMVVVDEAKASSSKNYTSIFAGVYTKALLQVHVEVIRKVLTQRPQFVAKRKQRELRKQSNRSKRKVPAVTVVAATTLKKVDAAWKKPANEVYVARLVTSPSFPPSPFILDSTRLTTALNITLHRTRGVFKTAGTSGRSGRVLRSRFRKTPRSPPHHQANSCREPTTHLSITRLFSLGTMGTASGTITTVWESRRVSLKPGARPVRRRRMVTSQEGQGCNIYVQL
jgi:hypothetical protein